MLHRTVDIDLIEAAHDAVAQAVALTGEVAGFLQHFVLRDGASFTQAHDAGDVQRARTHAALVAATIEERGKPQTRILVAHVQSSYTFGPVDFVARDRHQVDILLVDIDRHLADGLRRVGVKNHSTLAAEPSDFFNGVHHADFVIGGHDRY